MVGGFVPPRVGERKQHAAMEERHVSRGILRWESQDLVIPLRISVLHWRTPNYVGAATPRIQPRIAAALAAAAREGWQADEPIDFPTLFSRSRVRTTNTFIRWRITSATIRLTRPVRQQLVVPHGEGDDDDTRRDHTFRKAGTS